MSSDSQLSDLPSDADVAVDTSAGSILHHYLAGPKPVGPGALYFGAVAITFLPLLIAESVSGTLLPWSPHTLPFLYDANVLFMFLVSFPCLLILTVTDESVLTEALRTVRADGTVTIEEADWISIRKIWRGRFRVANWVAQVVGVIVGGVIAYINFLVYVPSDMPFWIAHEGHLLPVGFVFLYCIFAFYALVPIYVIRNIVISLLLRDLAVNSKLQMLPLHPDKCGGLRPVGQLGLRNQYALTLLGLNIVILVGVSSYFLDLRSGLLGLIVLASVAYVILGPVVFIGPLLPFRGRMLKNKTRMMRDVAQRLRKELDRLREHLSAGTIAKEDEELIERLRKIGTVIDELPVWPFDFGTLRKFLTAYIFPIAGTIGLPIASFLFSQVQKLAAG